MISLLEFFVAATRHHLEAGRLSQDARARALKEKSPLPTEVPVNFPMLGRLRLRPSDIRLALVRRNSYLAKSGLCDLVRRPLKALPIDAKRLFTDRMVEAIDLECELKKAQSGRSQGSQQQKKQYSKPAASPARQSSAQTDSSESRSGGSHQNQSGRGKVPRGCFSKGKAGNHQPKGGKP